MLAPSTTARASDAGDLLARDDVGHGRGDEQVARHVEPRVAVRAVRSRSRAERSTTPKSSRAASSASTSSPASLRIRPSRSATATTGHPRLARYRAAAPPMEPNPCTTAVAGDGRCRRARRLPAPPGPRRTRRRGRRARCRRPSRRTPAPAVSGRRGHRRAWRRPPRPWRRVRGRPRPCRSSPAAGRSPRRCSTASRTTGSTAARKRPSTSGLRVGGVDVDAALAAAEREVAVGRVVDECLLAGHALGEAADLLEGAALPQPQAPAGKARGPACR